MGIEDTANRGSLFHKATLKNKATVFTIGNRGDVITTQLDAPIIVPHTAQKTKVGSLGICIRFENFSNFSVSIRGFVSKCSVRAAGQRM